MRRERQQKAFSRPVAKFAGPSLAEQAANLKLGSLTGGGAGAGGGSGGGGGDHTTSTGTTNSTSTSTNTTASSLFSRTNKQSRNHHHHHHHHHRRPPVKTYFIVFASVICVYVIRLLPVLLSSSSSSNTTKNVSLQTGQQKQQQASSSSSSSFMGNPPKSRLRSSSAIMIPRPGEYAPMRRTDHSPIVPLVQLIHAPTMEYHVFCVSSFHDLPFATLTNAMMGLLDEPEIHLGIVTWNSIANQYKTRYKNEWVEANNITIVSQTLETDLGSLQREFRAMYKNIFFVLVDRGQPECQSSISSQNNNDNNNHNNHNNDNDNNMIMCVPLEDLVYSGIDDIRIVIQRIIHRLRQEFVYFSTIDFTMEQVEALRRLDYMDNMQLQMRDLPISSSETKYGIKGGTPI